MTTIAATETMVAADTQVTEGDRRSYAGKIFVFPDAIVAVAGSNPDIKRFMDWWGSIPRPAMRVPKGTDFNVIVLCDAGLFVTDSESGGLMDRVTDGVAAVGNGRDYALAAFDTMRMLKRRLDPCLAVRVAANRDVYTGGEIQSVRWRKRKL